ncbi:60S ribosomal protein L25 [Ceratobasidium sp. 428]|nr:60S ribosomal protein L25 [Ceratobasidium sp. 428]
MHHAPIRDRFPTIVQPVASDSAKAKIDDNFLVFVVDLKSNKRQIKDAMKKLYGVDVTKVNTPIPPDGRKKAYIRLTANHGAWKIANKGLTTIAASSIGVTAYATRALIDRLHRTNSRRTPLAHVLSRHFNHLAAATLPRISYVLNELAPYSGPLSLVAVNTLPSSPALTPYVNRVGAWLGPRKPTFDFELFFEWQPIHEDDGSIHCGSDDAYYLSLTGLCYRMPPRALLVRSLDVYRYDMKTLVVYGQMPRMPVCMPGDLAHLQRSGIRSAPISRQGNFVITSMNRVISVQQSMPVALSHSSSGAVLSLDIYRPEMKNLAVYGQATPLRRCIYTELLHTLFTALSTLAGIYRRGIAILTNFHPLRIALVFVCALALFRVYTQAMPIMICCGLTGKCIKFSDCSSVPNMSIRH